MAKIYLSPSTQEGNFYYGNKTYENSEEYVMNQIADAMIPYLKSSAINYTRNSKEQTAKENIIQSNAGHYDLHLAIHSNASPEPIQGERQGIEIFYSPASKGGKERGKIFKKYFDKIYPNPSLVKVLPTVTIGEVRKTKAPATFLEIGYHDNESDAKWLKNNVDLIGKTIVEALCYYFNIPFIEPINAPNNEENAQVITSSGLLNIRSKPSIFAPIIGKIPSGENVKVYGHYLDWSTIGYNGILGYVKNKYLQY